MKTLPWIVLLVILIALPGCSSCGQKEQPQTSVTHSMPAKEKQSPPSEMMEKKDEQEQPAVPAVKGGGKEKVLKIMPEIANTFQSPQFKQRLQEAAKSKDFKKLIDVMKEVMEEACSKEGLNFEECMKLMNEHKDDKDVKAVVEKWKDTMKLNK